MDTDKYDIAPYSDEEAMLAIDKLAHHPNILLISKYMFHDKPATYLRGLLKSVHSIDEYQGIVMTKAVRWVIDNTVAEFSFDGVENVRSIGGKFLALSNHRDIVLDPAFTQYALFEGGIPMTEIAVGDNLLSSKTVEYLLRSNRMIKVIRGVSARELYLSSQSLSRYIRETVTSGKSSVWIAQRQGRTKNGYDETEQGLLKMFDMSGTGSFTDNFDELNILPISISYEYEPCDIRKAREILISRTRKYVKKKNEDLHSIIIGIRQRKGNVHLHFGVPLTRDEIVEAEASGVKNDRYLAIRNLVSRRIIDGYRLWKTNYLCYDMLHGCDKYKEHYTPRDVEEFKAYMHHRLTDKVEKSLDHEALEQIFLEIYANPVQAKEDMESSSSVRTAA